jgi:hypothetical protein
MVHQMRLLLGPAQPAIQFAGASMHLADASASFADPMATPAFGG